VLVTLIASLRDARSASASTSAFAFDFDFASDSAARAQ
jgi:hypothetical protein